MHDSSGNGNDGTIYGATWEQLATGKWVLNFDGVDDYIKIPYSTTIDNFEELTIIVWIYPTQYAHPDLFRHIIDRGVWSDGAFGIIFDKFIKERIKFGIRINGVIYSCYLDEITELNKWYFIAATWDGTEMLLNINNVWSDSTQTPSVALSDPNTLLLISKITNPFAGNIGLVRIYNKTLTEDEIKTIYELEKPYFEG